MLVFIVNSLCDGILYYKYNVLRFWNRKVVLDFVCGERGRDGGSVRRDEVSDVLWRDEI